MRQRVTLLQAIVIIVCIAAALGLLAWVATEWLPYTQEVSVKQRT
jgi:hypothetical protein